MKIFFFQSKLQLSAFEPSLEITMPNNTSTSRQQARRKAKDDQRHIKKRGKKNGALASYIALNFWPGMIIITAENGDEDLLVIIIFSSFISSSIIYCM